MSKFIQESVSPAGAPTIEFAFDGDTVRAELAGAKLYAEASSDDGAHMRIVDADNFVLADITINARHGRTLTENVMDVGAALLWSHWRYVEAQREEARSPEGPPTRLEAAETAFAGQVIKAMDRGDV